MKSIFSFFLLFLPILCILSCEKEKMEKTIEQDEETIQEPEPLELSAWAPLGAKWYYSGMCDFMEDVDPNEKPVQPEGCISFYTIESVRDTIVQGLESRILQVKLHEKDKTTLLSEEIMRGTTKKVYHYNKEKEAFYLLYDFTKNEGDILEVDPELFRPNWGDVKKVSFKSRIDSVFTYKEWGNDLIAYDISFIYSEEEGCWKYINYNNCCIPSYLIEGIGSTFWMFGDHCATLTVMLAHQGLRCFEYNGQVYKYNDFPLECDYIK